MYVHMYNRGPRGGARSADYFDDLTEASVDLVDDDGGVLRIRTAAQAVIDSILGARVPMLQAPAPFRTLGLPYPCTADRLRARWRELARNHHPDRGGSVERFVALKAACDEAVYVLVGR